MIGRSGERGSEISVLAARHDDDEGLQSFMIDINVTVIVVGNGYSDSSSNPVSIVGVVKYKNTHTCIFHV